MNCILNKKVSTNHGSVGDIINFKIDIINNSKFNYVDVVVKDLLPSELKFILGSVVIDYREDHYSNILAGVNVGNIDMGKSKSISFDVEIINTSKKAVFSDAVVEYSFRVGESLKSGYACSEMCEIFIKSPALSLIRECNKDDVLLDDILKYTIKISNSGDLDILSLFLIEDIPKNTELIDGTFSIDGTIVNSVELEKGIIVDGISCGCSKIITYCTRVLSSSSTNSIVSNSCIKYSYILQNGLISYKESEKIYNTVKMSISSFKQLNIDEYLTISCNKPDIKEINNLKVLVDVNTYNIIQTSIAKSSEGKILSGYKLIVHGLLNQIVEYVADDVIQSVHTDSFTTPFSSYIILPQDFNVINNVIIEPTIENIYYNRIDTRSLFESISILLMVKSS